MTEPRKLVFKIKFEEPAQEKAPEVSKEEFERYLAEKYPEKRADDEDDAPLFDPENPDGYVDQDPLYNIACQLLPDRPVIRTTLDNIYNIDFIGLVTAGVIEQTCRGKLSDVETDRLTAAALMAAAENRGEVVALLPAGTVTLAQKLVAFAANPILESGTELTRDETCLYEAYLIAKLEAVHKGVKIDTYVDNNGIDFNKVADVLTALTAITPEELETPFAKRAKDCFNAVAKSLDLSKELEISNDNKLETKSRTMSLVVKGPTKKR